MITDTIIAHLLTDEVFARKALPYLKPEYFDDVASPQYRVVFEIVSTYTEKYNKIPTREAIDVELGQRVVKGFSDEVAERSSRLVRELKADPATDKAWLIDKTQDFCRRKAALSVALKGFEMVSSNKTDNIDLSSMYEMWSQAASISFDNELGHDYLEDAQARYDSYRRQEKRIPFDIPILNKITRGGLPSKSLSVILAPTGIGKSMLMGHLAAAQLMMGKNVLYFTLEMSAMEQIGERVDSNLMGVDVRLVESMAHDVYMSKITAMKKRTKGKFVIKEYPTASAGAHNFRSFINELRLKKNFVPDIIYVDYINLCVSSRVRAGSDANSYTIVKFIAEELRGLAMELDVPVVTATQTNRQGFNNSDLDLTSTAESIGLPQTADFMIALVSTEELEHKGQLQFKQLKNRWSGITENGRFTLGIDRSRMRLFELDSVANTAVRPASATAGLFAGFR